MPPWQEYKQIVLLTLAVFFGFGIGWLIACAIRDLDKQKIYAKKEVSVLLIFTIPFFFIGFLATIWLTRLYVTFLLPHPFSQTAIAFALSIAPMPLIMRHKK